MVQDIVPRNNLDTMQNFLTTFRHGIGQASILFLSTIFRSCAALCVEPYPAKSPSSTHSSVIFFVLHVTMWGAYCNCNLITFAFVAIARSGGTQASSMSCCPPLGAMVRRPLRVGVGRNLACSVLPSAGSDGALLFLAVSSRARASSRAAATSCLSLKQLHAGHDELLPGRALLERLPGAVAWIRPLGARGGAGTAPARGSPRRWWRTELAHQRRRRACAAARVESGSNTAHRIRTTDLENGRFSSTAFS
jgi:hypothetical protein